MSAAHRHPPCVLFYWYVHDEQTNRNGYSQRFNTLDARLAEIISTLGLLGVKTSKTRDKIKAKNLKG